MPVALSKPPTRFGYGGPELGAVVLDVVPDGSAEEEPERGLLGVEDPAL